MATDLVGDLNKGFLASATRLRRRNELHSPPRPLLMWRMPPHAYPGANVGDLLEVCRVEMAV